MSKLIFVSALGMSLLGCQVSESPTQRLADTVSFNDSAFDPFPGAAIDISARAGSVWAIGTDNGAYYTDGSANWWFTGGRGTRIAGKGNGSALMIGENFEILAFDPWVGSGWQSLSGQAQDIASNGVSAWITGIDEVVFSWSGGNWSPEPNGGRARKVAVDSNGTPWVVTSSNQVLQNPFGNQGWQLMFNDVHDIDANGTKIAMAGDDGYPYVFDLVTGITTRHTGFRKTSRVAIDDDGDLWAISSSDNSIHTTHKDQAGYYFCEATCTTGGPNDKGCGGTVSASSTGASQGAGCAAAESKAQGGVGYPCHVLACSCDCEYVQP